MSDCPNSEYKDNRHEWSWDIQWGLYGPPTLSVVYCRKCKRYEVRRGVGIAKIKPGEPLFSDHSYTVIYEGAYE